MRKVETAQVVAALTAAGVQPGDGLLVHSAIQFLGLPNGGPGMYYQALWSVLEDKSAKGDELQALEQGTLAAPAFNFAFARGEAYNPQSTPSQGMGAFSEYLRQLPFALRTPHPMQSLAVIGRYAGDLASRDTSSAFDPESAFERMLDLNFKLLLLGADIQAVSMLHYSEQRYAVPYRYWKEFSAPYLTEQGWHTRAYRMFVRDLAIDPSHGGPRIDLYPVQAVLQERKLWRSTSLNYGQIAACHMKDFVAVLDEFLKADPWSLVTNRM
jgi:aminoglycoside 3-N-acetyltransferase